MHLGVLQMHRLLRACTQQEIQQSKSLKEILTQPCATKCIIATYLNSAAGDYFKQLIAPTIRALQGPWTANEAGLKGNHPCLQGMRPLNIIPSGLQTTVSWRGDCIITLAVFTAIRRSFLETIRD
jgi:hypothetical protein